MPGSDEPSLYDEFSACTWFRKVGDGEIEPNGAYPNDSILRMVEAPSTAETRVSAREILVREEGFP